MSLPGADELFRTTGGTSLTSSTPRRTVPAPAGESDPAAVTGAEGKPEHAPAGTEAAEPRTRETEAPAQSAPAGPAAAAKPPAQAAGQARRRSQPANRRPSGRERHDEKITVYVSAEELMDLEHARLVLRGEHGLAVDRGRIVREAVAVVLADLESRGEASILVRRLRGR
ncbi:hypothetical protein [Streptomyces laurentii]|uniref:hypothetical protein n=1 Tax=Streptomyces laurentii TaxID=39478 RepID=UPI0036C2B193